MHCSGPLYAAVGTQQETLFPLEEGEPEEARLRRKTWASSYDSLPSSQALDDGLDPQPHRLDRWRSLTLLHYGPALALPMRL